MTLLSDLFPAPAGGGITAHGPLALPSYPGQLPIFGRGEVKVVYADAPFTVPVSGPYRIRVLGGGGGMGAAGQSSSFGTLISATGGASSSGVNGGVGGVGLGGEFQARGGPGGRASSAGALMGGGGGAAGSQLGDGGAGGAGSYREVTLGNYKYNSGGGGGGVGGHTGGTGAAGRNGGGSPLSHAEEGSDGVHYLGHMGFTPGLAVVDSLAPPYFVFPGGYATIEINAIGLSGQGARGLSRYSYSGGTGFLAGSSAGGVGGGGAGGDNSPTRSLRGGGQGGSTSRGGCGGGGFAMGVFELDADEVFAVTVAAGDALDGTSPGLVILEW